MLGQPVPRAVGWSVLDLLSLLFDHSDPAFALVSSTVTGDSLLWAISDRDRDRETEEKTPSTEASFCAVGAGLKPELCTK